MILKPSVVTESFRSKWMDENVPLFECPDQDIQSIYYFRWHVRLQADD
ncbi:hypothetical protein [Paenibacillus eucommiae]|uniref:Uncharacterized protein n=1 Tax=Paenibacillus eucommiae TaxID=1355755 RepID=A0ABS4INF1_9BACL|nr:hypothetical protein [Paenibacillus eucommiae]MBP1989085.1 hypothetical protein [Paenibacillus eucommiae]